MKGVQISTRCPSWQMVFLIISIFTVIIVPAVIVLHKKSTKHEMESSWMVNNATRAIKLPDSLRNASGNDNDIHASIYDTHFNNNP
jgi:competence protein ComGC